MIALPYLRQPVGPLRLNSASPLLAGVSGLWVFGTPRNLITEEPTVLSGTAYYGVGPRGQIGRMVAGGANRVQLAANTSHLVPTSGGYTIALHYRKLGSNIVSAAFGCIDSAGIGDRAGAHLPYSDGVVYFDYGGNAPGTSRLTASGLTFADDLWVFTTGPRGMEIWQNGIRRANNGGNPSRTALTTPYYLGTHGTSTVADDAECAIAVTAKRQWTPGEIVSWSLNPWQLIDPIRIYPRVASVTFNPAWAAAANSVIQPARAA